MNIVNTLTLRHIKTHKKRSILTILAIIVSVAMVTAVFTSALSFVNYFRNVAEAIDGSWHTYIHTSEYLDTKSVLDTDEIEKYGIDMWYAYADVDNDTKSFEMSINAVDENYLDLRNVRVSQGEIPKDTNELLVHRKFMEKYKLDWKIGDIVTLPVDIDGAEASQDFRIVGITESNVAETDSVSGFVYATEDYIKNTQNDVSVYVQFADLDKGVYDKAEKIARELNSSDEVAYGFNSEYLAFSGADNGDERIVTLAGFSGIILLIIAIVSIFMIYDSFAVSYQERARYLGMLASVGATKRQKRNSIYFEGLILGVIGIPLGIVAGIGGIWITFKAISDIWMNTMGVEYDGTLSVAVNWWVIAGTVLASAVTIFVSSYIPAVKASKTTAIDAIKQANNLKVKNKKIRTPKLPVKLLGYEGAMAVKNFKRNGKRSSTIVISLVMSVVVFVSVANFSLMFNDVMNYEFMETSDLTITVDYKDANQLEKVLKDNENIKEHFSIGDVYASVDEKYFTKDGRNYTNQALLAFVDNATIDSYLKQLGVDNKAYHDIANPTGILHNSMATRIEDKETVVSPFVSLEGESLTCQIGHWNEDTVQTEYSDVSILIGTQTTKDWNNDKFYFQNMHLPLLMLSVDLAPALLADNNTGYTANITSDDAELVDEEISSILQDKNIDFHKYNATAEMQAVNNILKIVDVFVFGFIALITLISIMNIINTISNSMNERRREFAMIRSVGMTPKSFKKMIYYESFRYGLVSLLWSIPISIGVNILLQKMLDQSFSIGAGTHPIVYLIAIVAVFIIIGIAILYSTTKIKNDNIIETLKLDIN